MTRFQSQQAILAEYRSLALATVRTFKNLGQEAEDIVQDFFIERVLKAGQLELFQAKGKGYFVASVKKFCLTRIKKQKQSGVTIPVEDAAFLGSTSNGATTALFSQDVQTWIRELSPREREVFRLRIGGYDNDEVAKELGVTPDAAKKAYSRACKRMQSLYKKYG